jgi:Fe-Mn family superoxide dismutase
MATQSVVAQAAVQELATGAGFLGEHKPRPLAFDPKKLAGLSEKLLTSHWENNYGGGVKALNAIEKKLASAVKDKDLTPNMYGALKREHLTRTGTVALHEYYFGNLGGNGKASGPVAVELKKWFGDMGRRFSENESFAGGGIGLGHPWIQSTHWCNRKLLVLGSLSQRTSCNSIDGFRYV